ncbi:MAG TPA: hypothetical protein VNQ90_08270 [Chthoniobacteraceae bacterium]|nr:hypothetical protein [Chthoniobacteraceae bacterium]
MPKILPSFQGFAQLNQRFPNIKFYVSMAWSLDQTGSPKPKIDQIAKIDISNISPESIRPFAEEVLKEYQALGGNDKVAKGTELTKKLLEIHRARILSKNDAAEASTLSLP